MQSVAIIHYNDVMMTAMTSQITSLTVVYSTVYSRRRSKKTSKLRVASRCEGDSPITGEFPAKGPVTQKMFPFDDVIIKTSTVNYIAASSSSKSQFLHPFLTVPGYLSESVGVPQGWTFIRYSILLLAACVNVFRYKVLSTMSTMATWGKLTLIVRFLGPTWGPSGTDRTQEGLMLALWTLLSGITPIFTCKHEQHILCY